MEPTPELIDAIYVEKVVRARRTSTESKILAGAELFEFARTAMEAGIRMQNPDASPERVRQLFQWRLRVGRIMESKR